MKHRFFVVYSQQALLPPKIYQRKSYLLKKISESPSYDYSGFHD